MDSGRNYQYTHDKCLLHANIYLPNRYFLVLFLKHAILNQHSKDIKNETVNLLLSQNEIIKNLITYKATQLNYAYYVTIVLFFGRKKISLNFFF